MKPGAVSVRYRTLGSDKMDFTFPEARTLNGKKIDLSKTKLFDGPYLYSEVGSEKLTMTYKNERRVLDFKSVKITQ
jgi:hypothetical protein